MAHETKDLLEKRHLQQNLLTGGANTNPLSDPSQLLDPQQAVQSRIEADLLRRAPMPSGTIPQVAAGPVSGAAVPPATAIGGTGTLPGGTVPVTAPGTTTPQGGLALGGGVGNVIGQLAGDPRFQQVLLQLALRGQPYGGIAATEIAAKEQAAQLERRRVAAMEERSAAETAKVELETKTGQREALKARMKEILVGRGEVPQDLIAQLGIGGQAVYQGLVAEIAREQIAVTLDLDEKLVKVAIERALRGQELPKALRDRLGPESTKYVEAAAKRLSADETMNREMQEAELLKVIAETDKQKKDTESVDFQLKQDRLLGKYNVQKQQYETLIEHFNTLGPNAPVPTWALEANIDEKFITSVREAAKHNEEIRHLSKEEQKSKIEYYLIQQLLTQADIDRTEADKKRIMAGGRPGQDLQVLLEANRLEREGTPSEQAAAAEYKANLAPSRQGVEPHYSVLWGRAGQEQYYFRGKENYERMSPEKRTEEQGILVKWLRLGLPPKHRTRPGTDVFIQKGDLDEVMFLDPEEDATLNPEQKDALKGFGLGSVEQGLVDTIVEDELKSQRGQQ